MATAKATTKRPLTTETKTVHRKKGNTFLQRFHTAIEAGETAVVKPPHGAAGVGHEVMFKVEGDKFKKGIVKKVGATTYTVQGARNNKGVVPIHTVPHANVVKQTDWAEYRYSPPKAPPKDANSSYAHSQLPAAELKRRGEVATQRIGFSESHIVASPSFFGPAITICKDLADSNGISTKLNDKPGMFWNRADSEDYQELLSRYSQGAMQAWRRELSSGKDKAVADAKSPGGFRLVANDKQTKINIDQFRDVILGKRHSSYVHSVMEREGKTEAIKYLKERKDARFSGTGTDISDMDNTPAGEAVLAATSTQPLQLKYALAVNKETLGEDVKKLVNGYPKVEQDAVRAKFGLYPYKESAANNEEVAAILNNSGHRDEGNRWTRNSVGGLLHRIIAKMKSAPTDEDALREKYSDPVTGIATPVTQWSDRDRAAYNKVQAATGMQLHMDAKLGRTTYNPLASGTKPTESIRMNTEPEPHGEIRSFSAQDKARYLAEQKRMEAERAKAAKGAECGTG